MNKKSMISVLFLTFFLFPSHVFAYLDLGTGSYFFQIFIATILAGLFLVRNWFKAALIYIKRKIFKARK